jgi:phenylalanyl-tRNA synthetase alpha chain
MPDPNPSASTVDRLTQDFDQELSAAIQTGNVQPVRDRYLGRKDGLITRLLKDLGTVPPEERRERGASANRFKAYVEQRIDEAAEAVRDAAQRAALERASLDVTLPGRQPRLGRRHPLTLVRDRMEDIFTRMGFAIVEGPEIEDEWHCFDALNMPAEHPARDMQDTLYLAKAWDRPVGAHTPVPATLLRTHTSAMQIRYMESHTPPVRVIAPGRVYRRDNLDLTHTPMFQQVEGLVVGEGVTMGDLKGTLIGFLRELFTADTPVVFRPSFFPYTEPSAEVDISCWACDGIGCTICKKSGWLEILGCGMVHPAVFEAVGYDAERYTGFAWGIGIERIAILRYQVEDIRLFYENDLRFLEQFSY